MAGFSRLLTERWLEEHLQRWVEAGLVSQEQAAEINGFERTGPSGEGAEATSSAGKGRFSVLSEAVSYLGILLVLVSGALVVGRFWDDLHSYGRLGVGLLVTMAGFGAATLMDRLDVAGARRVASFLRLCGTGGVALTAAVCAVALGSHDAGINALAAGGSVVVVSGLQWRNGDRVLPFLASIAGLVAAVVGLRDVLHLGLTPTEAGLVVWAVCLTLGVLSAFNFVHPALPALVVFEIGAIGAVLPVVGQHHAAGVAIGLATAAIGLVAGLYLKHNSMVIVGVIGSLIFLGWALSLYVRGIGTALGVLAAGLLLVALAIRLGGHHDKGAGGRTGRPHTV